MWNYLFRTTSRNSAILILACVACLSGMSIAASAEKELSPGQKAIEAFIEAQSHGGVFSVYDSREQKALVLAPGAIHSTAHLMKSGQTYYCVDFTGDDGTAYDLDFYVDERGASPIVVESFIHKANGADRIRPAKDAPSVADAVAQKVRDAITEAWKKPMDLYDTRRGKATSFTYENVHQGVKAVGAGNFYACVDARDEDNVIYDLDTYVKSTSDGGYEIAEIIVHKRDGIERLR